MAPTVNGVMMLPIGYFLFSFVTTALQLMYPIAPVLNSPRKQWLRDILSIGPWPASYVAGDFVPTYAWFTQLAVFPSMFSNTSFFSSLLTSICAMPLLAYYAGRFGAVPTTVMWLGSTAAATGYTQAVGWRAEDNLERGGFNRGACKDRFIIGPASLCGLASCYTILFFKHNLAAALPLRVRGAPFQMKPSAVLGFAWMLLMWTSVQSALARHTNIRSSQAFEGIMDEVTYKGQLMPATPTGGVVYGCVLAAFIIRRHHSLNAAAAARIARGVGFPTLRGAPKKVAGSAGGGGSAATAAGAGAATAEPLTGAAARRLATTFDSKAKVV